MDGDRSSRTTSKEIDDENLGRVPAPTPAPLLISSLPARQSTKRYGARGKLRDELRSGRLVDGSTEASQ